MSNEDLDSSPSPRIEIKYLDYYGNQVSPDNAFKIIINKFDDKGQLTNTRLIIDTSKQKFLADI